MQLRSLTTGPPAAGIDEKSKVASDAREVIEVVYTQEYPKYLRCFFKPFCEVLRSTTPQFSDNSEHKLRNTILDILHRLPQTDLLKPHVPELFEVLHTRVLAVDNQENGLIAIKIVFDLQKNFRGQYEREAQPFLDYVVQVRAAGTGWGEVMGGPCCCCCCPCPDAPPTHTLCPSPHRP